MKLAAKFARQESEPARLARVGRRRIRKDREEVIRRMLGIPEPTSADESVDWTRHRKAKPSSI